MAKLHESDGQEHPLRKLITGHDFAFKVLELLGDFFH